MSRSELRQTLRNQTVYQVFPRNYSKEGTLNEVINDLDRIKDLGVDIVYLLPIHPIGEVARKGKVGSPYAIQDYRAIHQDLGTMDDYKALIQASHDRGLKVMMDIVFNHTSRDSKLLSEHPDWFFYRDGKLANRVGDWSDVGDLDLNNADVRNYLIETLIGYVKLGVDGFRCDVAPLVPISFWLEAVQAVEKVKADVIWLSESIETSFLKDLRAAGHLAHSDGEMYQAFDILYNYDIYDSYQGYFAGKNNLKQYIAAVNQQEVIYPADYLKIRCLENHDQKRAADVIKNELSLINMTAWSFFEPGMGFLYAGQEVKDEYRPSLFEKEPIDLTVTDQAFYDFIKKLIQIKKLPVFKDKVYFNARVADEGDVIIAEIRSLEETYLGIFNLSEKEITIHLTEELQTITDLISEKTYPINQRMLSVQYPIIAKVK